MADFLFTVTFPAESGLPADAIVNTWHFNGGGSDPDNVVDMLWDYYNTVPSTGTTNTIVKSMTSLTIEDEMTVRGYDLSDVEPRVPVVETTLAISGLGSTAPLPRECAICMSYAGSKASGVNQASRRGRVFLGGWASAANSSGSVNSTLMATIAQKGEDLLSASIASVNWSWVVYSPTLGSSTPVTNGWVDDAWDTQRRRGLAATTRATFP